MPKPVEKEQPTTEEGRLLASINDTATLAFWRWWGSLED
jgi:hypothetical protein